MPIGKAKSAPTRHNYLTRNGPRVNAFNKMFEKEKATRESKAKVEAEKKKRKLSVSDSSASTSTSTSHRDVQSTVRSSRKRIAEIVQKEITDLIIQINRLPTQKESLEKKRATIISRYTNQNELIQIKINKLNTDKPLKYKENIVILTKKREDNKRKSGEINISIQNEINKLEKLKQKFESEIAKKIREIGYMQRDTKMDSLTNSFKKTKLNEQTDVAEALKNLTLRIHSAVNIK